MKREIIVDFGTHHEDTHHEDKELYSISIDDVFGTELVYHIDEKKMGLRNMLNKV